MPVSTAPAIPTTHRTAPYVPSAREAARIESLEKKPENVGIATSASEPARNAMYVFGRYLRKPPIFLMSCSAIREWMTMPAAMKRSALKNACVIRWNIPFAYAPTPTARNM